MSKKYMELRFANGLILSGFTEENILESLRNNNSPSQPLDPSSQLFRQNMAVLLQDQKVVGFAFGLASEEAVAFHQKERP